MEHSLWNSPAYKRFPEHLAVSDTNKQNSSTQVLCTSMNIVFSAFKLLDVEQLTVLLLLLLSISSKL
jgi:hypothetical protein